MEGEALNASPTSALGAQAREPSARRTSLSVVVPIHNEEALLADSVRRIRGELASVQPGIELILVENGSTDASAALSDALASELEHLVVIHLPEADYGAAMRAGLLQAHGAWRISFDIDYSSAAFVEGVLRCGESADIVLASKTMPGSNDRRSFGRRLGTRVFNRCLALLLGSRVSDTHGMKAVRAEVVERIVPRVISRRDLFDTELVLRAERAGCSIVELPVDVRELRPATRGLLQRVPRTLLGLLKLRLLFWREGRGPAH
jgi:hypothetical protein